jgi:hypothetical protein
MRSTKLLASIAILSASFSAPAVVETASARVITLEERDAMFEVCYNQYLATGASPNAASAYCYAYAYGNETSGGGSPEQQDLPDPVNHCYSILQCNPYIQPN